MEKINEELCTLRYLSKIFGGKWKMPIICILSSQEPKRYSVIKRKLKDVTDVMLAQSLKELEISGLIERKQYNEVPPRVEYSLTQKGKSTLTFLSVAAEWAANDMKKNSVCQFCDKCASI